MRGSPVLVVSRDEHTQDAQVFTLRRRRIAAFGVDTCGEAVRVDREVQLWGVLLDVMDEEDWQGCLLLRRLLRPGVRFIILTSHVAADRAYRRRAREMGCSGFVSKRCPPELVAATIEQVALGEPWVECVPEEPLGRC